MMPSVLSNSNLVIVFNRKDNFPKEFSLILEKNYGISKIVFGNTLT